MKTKIIPFDLETAKKIQAGEIKGKIKTRYDRKARILCTDLYGETYPMAVAISEGYREKVFRYNLKGRTGTDIIRSALDLVLEVPDNEPQFKPFDHVLVRLSNDAEWTCDIFSHICDDAKMPYVCVSAMWSQCIPYDGNENLVGTTNKPKEE